MFTNGDKDIDTNICKNLILRAKPKFALVVGDGLNSSVINMIEVDDLDAILDDELKKA